MSKTQSSDKTQNTKFKQYLITFLLAVLAGIAVSLCNFSILAMLALILFIIISFKYFNQVLIFLILYLPFQIALNIMPGVDLASGRVFILGLFAIWIIKSLAEKRFIIKLNLQTLLISAFLFIAFFSITQAWNEERAIRKILVFLSVFPLYFMITSIAGRFESLLKFDFPSRCSLSAEDCDEKARNPLQSSAERLRRGESEEVLIYKILNALILSGFVLSLIGVAQFAAQFFVGVDPIIIFWSKYIAPIFYGNTFGAEVVSNPSWLVNISGATVLRAFSLFPDPHMFSFYLGLLVPIVLAIVLCNKNNASCHPELVSGSTNDKGLSFFQFVKQSIRRIGKDSGHRQKILKQVQNDRQAFFNSKLLYLILLVMFLAELLTFSRGGYLGMIAGVGVVIILLWRQITFNKKIALGLISAIAIIFLLTASQSVASRFLSSFNFNEGSNTERIKNWSQGYEMFADNFLFGVGIGNYSLEINPTISYRTPVYAHNLYLDIGAEMGIFALIIWVILIIVTICQLYKASKNSKNGFSKAVSIGLIGSLVWFSVHSFFDTPIYSPTILAIFVVIISLAAIINSPFNKGG